ncbi:uncharacterized protein LOC136090955 [Hydra vulgaris]|uniref:Uncharacterized protein LOC136090955 n=1 Tax=Hydra vulgaris TaxID=6087 RepID=A0ABM4DHP2_HYDVU
MSLIWTEPALNLEPLGSDPELLLLHIFGITTDSEIMNSNFENMNYLKNGIGGTNGCPIERFSGFLPNSGHKSKELANAIFFVLEPHGLDINKYQDQDCDNASNISGKYTGLQTRIKEVNFLTTFVQCLEHSLNLVVECTMDCLLLYIDGKYFRTIKLKLKKSDTWRSASSHASMSLNENWNEIINALSFIKDDNTQKLITRSEANGLYLKLDSPQIALIAKLWGDIGERFNKKNDLLKNIISLKEITATQMILYNQKIDFIGYLAAIKSAQDLVTLPDDPAMVKLQVEEKVR